MVNGNIQNKDSSSRSNKYAYQKVTANHLNITQQPCQCLQKCMFIYIIISPWCCHKHYFYYLFLLCSKIESSMCDHCYQIGSKIFDVPNGFIN